VIELNDARRDEAHRPRRNTQSIRPLRRGFFCPLLRSLNDFDQLAISQGKPECALCSLKVMNLKGLRMLGVPVVPESHGCLMLGANESVRH